MGGRLDYLRARFGELGIRPQKWLGQNFLLDRNQVRKICRDAGLFPLDTVLEIGPGTGLLSVEIARTGARLVCIELDRKLIELVREELAPFAEAEVLEGDALADKNTLNPQMLAAVDAARAERGGGLKCVSNLPYNVATPLMANLLADPRPWSLALFMLQYEVAERLVARPGSGAYGSLSVVTALAAERAVLERAVPPQVFWPRPKVKSAVARIVFRSPEERAALPWAGLRRVTTAVFGQRRKTLRNALKGIYGKGEDAKLRALLERVEIDLDRRGETLEPEVFLELARALD